MDRITFGASALDGYLLGGDPPKAAVVATVLAARSPDPKAQAFYRAIEAIGARAADEAFIALRLVLAGLEADDRNVARLRALVRTARTNGPDAAQARADYETELRRSPADGST
jgi:hypothetical protein